MSHSYDYEYMEELFPEEHNPIDVSFDIEQICHQTAVYKYKNQLIQFANRPGLGQSERRMFVNLLFKNADLVFNPMFIKPQFLTNCFMESLTMDDKMMIFNLSVEYGNVKTD